MTPAWTRVPAALRRLVGRLRLPRRRWAPLLGAVLAVSVGAAAYGYWTTTGAGTSTANTAPALLLTISPGTPAGNLHPGGLTDVAVVVSNPNPYAARIGALALDPTQGTGGYSVDLGHAACGVGALAFTAQTNNGAGWSVPPKVANTNGSLTINLASALSMDLGAANACQGAAISVFLTASADYLTATLRTAGLVSYWPLGADPSVADNFTDTAGTTLQAHTGETGASWTPLAGSGSATEVVTTANRLRRNGGYAVYHASGAASGADYAVMADVHVRSAVAGDMTGVTGRLDTGVSNGTFYYARYERADTAWHLGKVVNGVGTNLATSAGAALTVGDTYRLRLDMTGTAIKLYVDEVLTASATDASITAAGRGGVLDGDWKTGTTSANSDSTGLHLDNVRVVTGGVSGVTDRLGVNAGTIGGAPLRNVPGALVNDLNTAMRFNGSPDRVGVARQIQDDFSIEFWFRSTQGIGTGAQWWNGAGLIDAQTDGPSNDFGVSLRADGRIVAGIGTPDVSIVSASAGHNDAGWHHVVFTRDRTAGVLRLYVDGTAAGTATGASTLSLTAASTLEFGRLANATNSFVGTLDEVAVYNVVLSGTTVTDHYRIGSGA